MLMTALLLAPTTTVSASVSASASTHALPLLPPSSHKSMEATPSTATTTTTTHGQRRPSRTGRRHSAAIVPFPTPLYLSPSANPTPTATTAPPPPHNLSMLDLVRSLTDLVSPTSSPPPPDQLERIYRCMKSYDATLGEWRRYAKWDTTKKYTRNLIATDNSTFTLMLLCWNPAKGSPVHNHAGSECFMRMIDGHIVETQYEPVEASDSPRLYPPHGDLTADDNETQSAPGSVQDVLVAADRPDPQQQQWQQQQPSQQPSQRPSSYRRTLRVTRRVVSGPGDVNYVNDNIGLHKVENVFDEPAITLHLYVPPYEKCLMYDEETGAAQTGYVTFHSEYGVVRLPAAAAATAAAATTATTPTSTRS